MGYLKVKTIKKNIFKKKKNNLNDKQEVILSYVLKINKLNNKDFILYKKVKRGH